MPSEYVYTEVEGQRIRLSNIDRVIFPDVNITKAEIIQYFLTVGDYILPYIKNRPLTLIRFPDGVNKERFYAKQKPKWTPDWINSFSITHSTEEIHYLVVDKKVDLAWLANISALELHPMQFTISHEESPDHFIFDLDPPENSSFDIVKEIAFLLKPFLEDKGYTPFVKTSGSKGLHILVPIIKKYTHEEMTESVKTMASQFVNKYPNKSTLHLAKNKRDNKVLMDIFRNHKAHTTVAPYSLRGKSMAPISMPISWKMLEELNASTYYTIQNYREHLDASKQAWSNYFSAAAEIQDRKKIDPVKQKITERKLEAYYEKRNFNDTPEPKDELGQEGASRYSIQLHNASNLHYDLRLEYEGTLLSWAIPKGLPLIKKTKRLAIRTEDHPLSYLYFEGTIPKGNYGAGDMWIYETGTFKWIKKEEKKYHIELNNNGILTEYKLYNTKGEQWLIDRVSSDNRLSNSLIEYKPMLADAAEKYKSGNLEYEIKWDGIRALIVFDDSGVKVISRGQKNLTEKFPELQSIRDYLDIEQGVFDGEIVCLDNLGKPVFSNVISRMHSSGSTNIEHKSKSNPAVIYLFDCLIYDGKDVTHLPLTKRRDWLKAAFKKQETYRYSNGFEDGKELLTAIKEMGLEGIMIKEKDGKYHQGIRNATWLKLKTRHIEDAIIIGYTKGKGDRSAVFGSLHLAKLNERGEGYTYMGRVGSGFSSDQLSEYFDLFQEYIIDIKPIKEKVEEENKSVWMKPKLSCEIKYASLTNNGTYREPIFLKLRQDLL